MLWQPLLPSLERFYSLLDVATVKKLTVVAETNKRL